jgi:hypothetical protein
MGEIGSCLISTVFSLGIILHNDMNVLSAIRHLKL